MGLLNKFQKTVVFILKATLYVLLTGTFFAVFGTKFEWLLHPSRTAAVTLVTFVAMETLLISVYGGYLIGRLKSKPIAMAMSLATIITDFVTHFQLCIMNVNESLNNHFIYEAPHLLVLVMIIQIALIIFFSYFGNYVYFAINSPEKCCVIISSKYDLNEIIPKIRKYKKQYVINDVVMYNSKEIFSVIMRNDTVFFTGVPNTERTFLLEFCYANNKNINYNYEMSDLVAMGGRNMMLDDKPMMCAQVRELTLEQRILKRAIDLFVSTIALVVAGPVMLACALAIKMDDGGPVFYKQKRLTYKRKVFEVYKFRSMRVDAEKNGAQWAKADDDRVTRVGKILRKFRLDELPQFINIFKGEMSLVGPRPERPELASEFEKDLPQFSYRLNVKAGLTGLAQVMGKYNTTPADKLAMDLIYVEKFSIWHDIKLILQTLTVFLKASDSTEGLKENDYCEELEIIE